MSAYYWAEISTGIYLWPLNSQPYGWKKFNIHKTFYAYVKAQKMRSMTIDKTHVKSDFEGVLIAYDRSKQAERNSQFD